MKRAATRAAPFRLVMPGLLLHADPPSAEQHGSLGHGEQGVIPAYTDVGAGTKLRASLANNNRPDLDFLTTVHLHAQKLGITVATVSR